MYAVLWTKSSLLWTYLAIIPATFGSRYRSPFALASLRVVIKIYWTLLQSGIPGKGRFIKTWHHVHPDTYRIRRSWHRGTSDTPPTSKGPRRISVLNALRQPGPPKDVCGRTLAGIACRARSSEWWDKCFWRKGWHLRGLRDHVSFALMHFCFPSSSQRVNALYL